MDGWLTREGLEPMALTVGSWVLEPPTAEFIKRVLLDYYAMPDAVASRETELKAFHGKELTRVVAVAIASERAAVAADDSGIASWQLVLWVAGGVTFGLLVGFLAGAVSTN